MGVLRKHLPKRRWLRVVVYLVGFFVFLLAADMVLVQYWRRIAIGVETTRITAPVTTKGYADYLGALNEELSKGVTDENNAARLLVRVVPVEQRPEIFAKNVLPMLGVKADEPVVTVVDYATFMARREAGGAEESQTELSNTEAYRKASEKNLAGVLWKKGEVAGAEEWIKANEAALDLLHEAVKRERYYVPLVGPNGKVLNNEPGGVIAALLPALGTYRALANVGVSRAMMRLGEGDFAGYQADIVAVMKLARLVAQGRTLIEQLVAYAIEGVAVRAVQVGLEGEAISVEGARELARAMRALPAIKGLAESVDRGERFMYLDCICMVAEGGVEKIELVSGDSEPSTRVKALSLVYPIHFDQVLRDGNSFYDGVVGALQEPVFAARAAKLKAVEEALLKKKSAGLVKQVVNPSNLFLGMLAPSLIRVAQLQAEGEMGRGLAIAGLELSAAAGTGREYPASLPVLIDVLDLFTQKPLVYRKEGRGYVLYSVGIDGVDNGGVGTKRGSGAKEWDVVLRVPAKAAE